MKYILEAKSKEVIKEQIAIIVDGEEVGMLKDTHREDRDRWHAILEVKGRGHIGLNRLAQGHGDTQEQAIENAFTDSMREAENYLNSLAILREKMFGEDGK